MLLQGGEEGLQQWSLALHYQRNSLQGIAYPAPQLVVLGEAMYVGAKAHPLHQTLELEFKALLFYLAGWHRSIARRKLLQNPAAQGF